MPFSYTQALEGVLELICESSSLFDHVELDKVLVSFSQARKRTSWGIYAKVVPLRFEEGRTIGKEGDTWIRTDEFTFEGREILYLLYVYLPRFHDQSFRDKVLTLFHELFHIHPEMNGDLRRLPGPNPFHGASREEYDRNLEPFVDDFLDSASSDPRLDFLRQDLGALSQRHRGVSGRSVPQPEFEILGDLCPA